MGNPASDETLSQLSKDDCVNVGEQFSQVSLRDIAEGPDAITSASRRFEWAFRKHAGKLEDVKIGWT